MTAVRVEQVDWGKVARLSLLSADQLLTDMAGLLALTVAAAPDGTVAARWAHRLVEDCSVLDRLYHVGLIHLACDPACCATPRRREYYSVHEWSRLS